MMMKAVFVTDIHGDEKSLTKTLEIGKNKDVRAVFIGGDIGPFLDPFGDTGQSIIHNQRDFLENVFIPKIREFVEKTKKDVFVIMGNDDFEVNIDLLKKAEKEGILKLVHMKKAKLDNTHVIGYSYINPIPSMMQDWEKSEKHIERDLKKIAKGIEHENTIWLFNAVPFDTNLDIVRSGTHVGSKSIKRFIGETQPRVTLHGHIHESPEMSGNFYEKIGRTISINPGNKYIAIFDIDNPQEMEFVRI